MTPEMTESELVAGLRNRDARSFEELISRFSEKVLHLAMRLTRNEADAEEVVQEVFLSVFRRIELFEGKAALSSWIYRITANTAFMRLRKRKQHAAISMEDVQPVVRESWTSGRSDEADTTYLSTRHELRAALQQAVERLPEEYRMIFVMRDVDGLSNEEVGDVLGMSVAAVKSRLHRSRLMLRKKLERFYEDYADESTIAYGPGAVARQARPLPVH